MCAETELECPLIPNQSFFNELPLNFPKIFYKKSRAFVNTFIPYRVLKQNSGKE